MTPYYTTKELLALADDKGPFFADNARQALKWAAHTLDAAQIAIEETRLRNQDSERLRPATYRRVPVVTSTS